ncbi:hypothetical protein C8F01DRAFT_1243483 [Mycena amicta]|nr:hypothetical protein C8F01DRAFT_1243483 [Mycena amicta]
MRHAKAWGEWIRDGNLLIDIDTLVLGTGYRAAAPSHLYSAYLVNNDFLASAMSGPARKPCEGLGSTAVSHLNALLRAHRVYKVTLRMLAYALCRKKAPGCPKTRNTIKKLFNKVVALVDLQSETAVAWAKATLEELTK